MVTVCGVLVGSVPHEPTSDPVTATAEPDCTAFTWDEKQQQLVPHEDVIL